MRQIRVLSIITRLEQGGAPLALIDTISRLPTSIYKVDLAAGRTRDPNRDLTHAALHRSFHFIPIPALQRDIRPLQDLRAFFQIVSVIRSGRYDLVHTHTSKAGILGRIAAGLCGVPAVVHSPHGTILEGYFGSSTTRFFILLERIGARLADRIICLTKLEIDQSLAVRIGQRRQYTYIYNGIDIRTFAAHSVDRNQIRKSLGIHTENFVCITVGRLVPVKGHGDLLIAFRQAVRRNDRLHLLIVGDGELRDDLRNLSEELGIFRNVHFLGWREDVAELLEAADLFLLPSHNEGQGLVLVEAMAKRLPVIATRVGGVPEVVVDEETGLLVPPHSPESIAEGLLRMATDRDRARRMGEAGYKRAVDRFSIDRTVHRTDAVFRQLTGCPH